MIKGKGGRRKGRHLKQSNIRPLGAQIGEKSYICLEGKSTTPCWIGDSDLGFTEPSSVILVNPVKGK